MEDNARALSNRFYEALRSIVASVQAGFGLATGWSHTVAGAAVASAQLRFALYHTSHLTLPDLAEYRYSLAEGHLVRGATVESSPGFVNPQ